MSEREGWWPPEVEIARRHPSYWSLGFDVGPFCFGASVGFGPDRDFRIVLYAFTWKIKITQHGYVVLE